MTDKTGTASGLRDLCGRQESDRQNQARCLLCLLTGSLLLGWPIVIVVAIFSGDVPAWGIDFKAYYLAGLRARTGASLYQPGSFVHRVSDPAVTSYLYPPIVAVAFIPLSMLPIGIAHVMWIGVQLAILSGSVLVLVSAAGVRMSPRRVLLVSWLVLGFQPVVTLARIGNISGFIAAGLCLSAAVVACPVRDRRGLAGVLAALATIPKPFVAPGVAHLLLDRRRFIMALVTLGVAGGSSLLLFGIPAHREYLEILLTGKGWGAGGGVEELPLKYRPFHSFPLLQLPIQGSLLCITFLASLSARKMVNGRRASLTVIALGSLTIPLANPAANTLTLVLAVPGLVTAGVLELERDGYPEIVVLAVLFVQISVRSARLITALGDRGVLGIPWHVLGGLAYLIQPATVGLLLVYGLLVYRILVTGDEPTHPWTGRSGLPTSR